MKKAFFLLVLTIFFKNIGYAQSTIELDDGNGAVTTLTYVIKKKSVEFTFRNIYAIKIYPSVLIDVNKDGMVDKMLDRAYGTTGSSNGWKLCSQYLIDETSSTPCGDAPSQATYGATRFTSEGKPFYHTFNIPKKELITSGSPDVIHVMFKIVQEKNGQWTFTNYPACSRIFEKVYEIKLK